MKNILKVNYCTGVHLFWTVLLLFIGFQLNHSYGDYIAKNNIYDLHFARAGMAGIGMAAVYFMLGLMDRKGNPVMKVRTVLCMYFSLKFIH